jgi:Delta carbonic anhydrase
MLRQSLAALAAITPLLAMSAIPSGAIASEEHGSKPVPDSVITGQLKELSESAAGKGYGPQSPRDIENPSGKNRVQFDAAPDRSEMNLCNIHFHEGAEHKGGQFKSFIGNGDGKGFGTGFKYTGQLTKSELQPIGQKVGSSEHGDLKPGDTIEIHFVHSTAQVKPGPTLGACVSKEINNPQLRVEAVVAVLVNDRAAADFTKMADVKTINGYYSAPNIPGNLGKPVSYGGSTTGPAYNIKGSPYQVTWSVRPKVVKVDILSVAKWLSGNPFNEDHAHGVRNLVLDPALLSPIR